MASFLGVRVPFTADGTAFKRGLNNMRKDSEGFAGSLKSMFKDAFSVAGGIGIASGVGKLIDGIKSLGTQAVKGAADMESLQIAFEVMLGSAKDAKKLLADLGQYAEQTPLTLSDLTQGTKTLMQFGVSLDDVLPALKMLGEVSAGDAQKLQSLTVAFGQISSAGRLQGQDLLQLINVGFNPLQEISKKTGETMLELKKRMEAGGIGIEEVKGAFAAATSEGGRFYGMLERQSKTTNGLLSTLKDAWEKILRTIGTPINNWLKPWIESAIASLSKFADGFSMAVKGGEAMEFLKLGMLAAVETFKDAMISAAKDFGDFLAVKITHAAMRIKGGASAEQADFEDEVAEANARGMTITQLRKSKGAGGKSEGSAMAKYNAAVARLADKATAATIAGAAFENAGVGGVGAGGKSGGMNHGMAKALENAVRNAFGFRIGGTPGAIVGDRPEMKQGEIPSIIASELATMGLGGRAAGFGGFDPLVEQMKNSVDYQRRMAEYLQQIASKSGAYEPVA